MKLHAISICFYYGLLLFGATALSRPRSTLAQNPLLPDQVQKQLEKTLKRDQQACPDETPTITITKSSQPCSPAFSCCINNHPIASRLTRITLEAAQKINSFSSPPNDASIAQAASKILPMILRESGGNPVTVTDMKGQKATPELDWTSPRSMQLQWEVTSVDQALRKTGLKYNKQTNFGLLQQSQDLLINDKEGEVGKIIDRYQKLIKNDPQLALNQCDTTDFFKNSSALRSLFSALNTCDIRKEPKCFGKLMILCPRLNVELAARTYRLNPSYFQSSTQKVKPACEEFFLKQLKNRSTFSYGTQ